MTQITHSIYKDCDKEELVEVLIKNLPNRIKAGNEKFNANVYEYETIIALKRCKFINFNSKERISFMIFDIDNYKRKTALEYFKTIDNFLNFIIEKIGYEPTYILQTDKGFHFGFALKNQVFTNQKKALAYLKAVKETIGKKTGCDMTASNKLHGVWRNPLLHPHYYSKQINFELKDFLDLLPKRVSKTKARYSNKKVDITAIEEGNRNNELFKNAMKFAKGESYLTAENIFEYIEDINCSIELPLEDSELWSISKSVYRYWETDSIKYGTIEKKDINEGIMEFEKMKGLTREEYEEETKRRQKLSAKRTNDLVDNEKKKSIMLLNKAKGIEKRQRENRKKVEEAIDYLRANNLKTNVSQIAKACGLDRRTINKYL